MDEAKRDVGTLVKEVRSKKAKKLYKTEGDCTHFDRKMICVTSALIFDRLFRSDDSIPVLRIPSHNVVVQFKPNHTYVLQR